MKRTRKTAIERRNDAVANIFSKAVIIFAFAGLASLGCQAGEAGERTEGAAETPPAAVTESSISSRQNPGDSFDHTGFHRLLGRFVDKHGWIDYVGLASEREALDIYLESLAAAEIEPLDDDEALALLINAYNAFTLKLILERAPLDSITELPEDESWDAVRWKLAGRSLSLNQIEHQEIRARFTEPRIHFALVCAAVGCPPLRAEAYDPRRLAEQLEEQTRYVHAHRTWLRYGAQARVVELTPLYDWYAEDFVAAAGSVLAYVGRYVPEIGAAVTAGAPPEIRWLDYDWALNSLEHRQAR